jgi:hypothetical protein
MHWSGRKGKRLSFFHEIEDFAKSFAAKMPGDEIKRFPALICQLAVPSQSGSVSSSVNGLSPGCAVFQAK